VANGSRQWSPEMEGSTIQAYVAKLLQASIESHIDNEAGNTSLFPDLSRAWCALGKIGCLRACSVPRNCPRILCNLENSPNFFNFKKTVTVWHPFLRLVLGNIFWNHVTFGNTSSHFLLLLFNSCKIFSCLLTLAHTLSTQRCQLSHHGFRLFITT